MPHPSLGRGRRGRLDQLVHTKPEVVLRALAEAGKGKV
jgi:hypothetical protein